MRAMVLHEWGGPLTLETVPDPAPGHGEAVLRVHACAPDQFDVTIRAGRIGGKLPLIMGHEIAGEVAALVPGVEGWEEGARAVVHAYLTCGRCRRVERLLQVQVVEHQHRARVFARIPREMLQQAPAH